MIAGAGGSINVVLQVVIEDIATNGSFGDGAVRASKLDVLAFGVTDMVDGWAVIDCSSVIDIAVNWRVIIWTF